MPFQSSVSSRGALLGAAACFTAVVMYIALPIRLLFGIIIFRRYPNMGSSQPSKPPFCFRGPSSKRALHPPDPNSLGVLRVVAIRIEPKATTEARVVADSVFGSALYKSDNLTVSAALFPEYFGKRKVRLPCRHLSVEGMDASIGCGVQRRPSTLKDKRQVLQRLLFPTGYVYDNVSHRPGFRNAGLHHLGV